MTLGTAPWLVRAVWDALPNDGSPILRGAVFHRRIDDAAAAEGATWTSDDVESAIAMLLAARHVEKDDDGLARGVPEGFGWRHSPASPHRSYLCPTSADHNNSAIAEVRFEDLRYVWQWKIKGGDWITASGKGLGGEPARQAAVRACWAAGRFGDAAITGIAQRARPADLKAMLRSGWLRKRWQELLAATPRVDDGGAPPALRESERGIAAREHATASVAIPRRPLDGFKRVARFDSARRRSIWYRENQDGSLELRSGRKDGDDHVRLAPGEVVTSETLGALAGLLRSNAWATEQTEQTWNLDELDEHVGPFGILWQSRALDAAQIDRLARANMIAGRPWGCAEVDALAFYGVDDETVSEAETTPPKLTACKVASFRSDLLERKRSAFSRSDLVRGAWLLSDGREVLLTRYILMVEDGHRVYVGAYPAEAGAGLAVQCVMTVPAGQNPFPLRSQV